MIIQEISFELNPNKLISIIAFSIEFLMIEEPNQASNFSRS